MAAVLTLDARKLARAREIRAGFELLCSHLSDFGRRNGGAFWICGSAVKDALRYDSDIDILVDFDDSRLGAAVEFVEDACARLNLTVDVQPKKWRKAAFIEKISQTARKIP